MKIYTDYKETINFKNTWIPKNPVNNDYIQFLQEVKEGKAKLVPYIPPVPTWEQIRSQRDAFLKDSDWSVAGDANPKPSKEAWLSYRQSLRDIPSTFKTPEEVVWPEKPR